MPLLWRSKVCTSLPGPVSCLSASSVSLKRVNTSFSKALELKTLQRFVISQVPQLRSRTEAYPEKELLNFRKEIEGQYQNKKSVFILL